MRRFALNGSGGNMQAPFSYMLSFLHDKRNRATGSFCHKGLGDKLIEGYRRLLYFFNHDNRLCNSKHVVCYGLARSSKFAA
jgi:hypothetical protein